MPAKLIVRGSDKLITAKADMKTATASDVHAIARKESNEEIRNYKPDGCGALLLFHTPDHKIYGLGTLRANPALKDKLTNENQSFSLQMDTEIGGKLFNPDASLKEQIVNAVKFKMYFKQELQNLSDEVVEAQKILHQLISIIADSHGWGDDICVHTDHWTNKDESVSTMNYLTAIKHINCTKDDLDTIENALKIMTIYQKSTEENPRNFQTYPFIKTMNCATEDSFIVLNELDKAKIAAEKDFLMTFNDLCLKTFKDNGSYHKYSDAAELSFSSQKLEVVLN